MASAKSTSSYSKRGDYQRFIDVGKESSKILLPPLPPIIHQHSSTSSLQEAVQPICHLVEDLPKRVAISLERCQNPKDGLTRDESAAIYLYTQQWPPEKPSFYTTLNRALRDENRENIAPFSRYLNLFMSAFKKLPSIEDRVWRGETGDWGSQYQPETMHVWWGVSSCTDMVHVTSGFLDESQKRTLFNIKCVNGKMIKNHSAYPDESETILPPGTCLRVKSSLNAAPNLCIVELEEVGKPTPKELIHSASVTDEDVASSTSQIGNVYVIWFDPELNRSQENKNTQKKLKHLFGQSFKPIEDLEETVNYLRDNTKQRFVLITGGVIGKHIVPRVHDFSQLQAIVLYCLNKPKTEQWSRNYAKVKAVVVPENEMIRAVQELYEELTGLQKPLSSNKPESHNLLFGGRSNERQNIRSASPDMTRFSPSGSKKTHS